ncbi:hypothetical protein ACF0H5_021465 [Mactra antiquata]
MEYTIHFLLMIILVSKTFALDQNILSDTPIHRQIFSYLKQQPHSETGTGSRHFVLERPRYGSSYERMKFPMKMKKQHWYGMDSARRQTRLAKFGSLLVPESHESKASKIIRYG